MQAGSFSFASRLHGHVEHVRLTQRLTPRSGQEVTRSNKGGWVAGCQCGGCRSACLEFGGIEPCCFVVIKQDQVLLEGVQIRLAKLANSGLSKARAVLLCHTSARHAFMLPMAREATRPVIIAH